VAEVEERGLHGGHRIEVVVPAGPHTRPHIGAQIVHGPETFALVAEVLARGAGWFRRLGTVESPGTTIVTVVGDVDRPVVTEVELGTTIREIVGRSLRPGGPAAGGIRAVITGRGATVLRASDLDAPLQYEPDGDGDPGVPPAGALVVLGEASCAVAVTAEIMTAYAVGSCRGRCRHPFADLDATLSTPSRRLRRVTPAVAAESQRQLADAGCCRAAERAARVLAGLLDGLADEFAAHAAAAQCRRLHDRTSLQPDEVVVVDGVTSLPIELGPSAAPNLAAAGRRVA
jgi:NADH:ubiquinone oxidoreductase subunit F (NADH-binding)